MNRKSYVWLALAVMLTLVTPAAMPGSTVRAAETKDIVVLGTSDIHGQVDAWDYFGDKAFSGGLTKVATYVNNTKATNPNTILIDDGDVIQGTPLSYYYEVLHPELENPMAATMNAMGFVASTVGNHEFNYGPTIFNKYQSDADFPLLSANVTGCADYTFEPYVINHMDVGGGETVDVGILGLTPPAVPHWEQAKNITGCVFGDPIVAANKYVPEMKAAGADVLVVAAHAGTDETYGYGLEEDFAKALANQVSGIDVILAGHAHSTIAGDLVNGVLITEPSSQAKNVSDIRLKITGSGSDWEVTQKSSTAPSVGGLDEDPVVKAVTDPYHDGAVAYINTPIGTAAAAFTGGFQARIADGPTADLINQVQMDSAAAAGFPAQASLAALFNNSAQLNAGPIKLKDAYALYIYDNTLYVVDATGQQIKNELEWTAGYFNQYYYTPDGVTKNSQMADYNYDLWSGIDYKIDVTKPVGQRVVELDLNGKPLAMTQHVNVALNNYRATGQFKDATILYQSTTQVRDLITDWITAKGTISPSDVHVHNYDLLPPPATWLSSSASQSITRADYASLLWTGFAGSTGDYMKLPGEKTAETTVPREGALYLLGNRAMNGNWDVTPNQALLKSYTDFDSLSAWAKVATAYALAASIYTPARNQLQPKQTLTNADALALVREATYPLFTFLSTNDFHGQLQPKALSSSNPALVGGAAYDMAYINNYRALNPAGTTLLDAGDEMQGTPISNLLKGESVIDVFNHMGYEAAVVGNHEFDWGLGTLQDRMAQADYPILAANIFLTGTDTRPSWAEPTAMFTVKGRKVGVIGVTSKDTPTIVMAGNTAGLDFRPVGPIVTQLVSDLRAQGAELVVVLAHMPDVYGGKVTQEIVDVAQPGVDLIVSGHSHSGYSGVINGVPIIQAYSSGTAIGVSNLSYDRLHGGIVNASLKVVTTYNAGMTPDPGIAALVAHYQDVIGPTVNAVVATLDVGPITRTQNASGESAMGDLVADAAAWKGGTQIGFTNPGGLRADIGFSSYPHDVTWTDIFNVQPFDNKLVTMTLTGSQLYDVLEQQFVTKRMLPISGFKYTWNSANPVGSKIVSVTLKDGTPVLKDTTAYTATMNEYIGTGGDGFSSFLAGTNFTRIGVSDLDALLGYVQHVWGTPGQAGATPIDPTVYPKIDGRVTKL